MILTIDPEICTGCGLCEESCPYEAIEVVNGLAAVNEACTLCGACVDACPEEAITMPEKTAGPSLDRDSYKGVWVFCEQRHGQLHSVGLELLGKGRELADELKSSLVAVIFGRNLDGMIPELIGHGVDTVLSVSDPLLEYFTDDVYGQVLSSLIKERKPEIVLCGATALGRSFFPRVAAEVEAGLTADCTELTIDQENNNLLQTRPAFGGNIMATIVCPEHRPQMATVRPKVMRKPQPGQNGKGEIVDLGLPQGVEALSRVMDSIEETSQSALLAEAEIIVAAGRGIQEPKNLDLVRELADLLGGAVGATRGVVDAEWIPYAHQIGQTGRTVSPKLYLAIGVSGAVQHVVGMQSSQFIVAVNNDPGAPIFDVATYGLVGDLFEIVPAMIQRLKGS